MYVTYTVTGRPAKCWGARRQEGLVLQSVREGFMQEEAFTQCGD